MKLSIIRPTSISKYTYYPVKSALRIDKAKVKPMTIATIKRLTSTPNAIIRLRFYGSKYVSEGESLIGDRI